jgi:hypothetical protein
MEGETRMAIEAFADLWVLVGRTMAASRPLLLAFL